MKNVSQVRMYLIDRYSRTLYALRGYLSSTDNGPEADQLATVMADRAALLIPETALTADQQRSLLVKMVDLSMAHLGVVTSTDAKRKGTETERAVRKAMGGVRVGAMDRAERLGEQRGE